MSRDANTRGHFYGKGAGTVGIGQVGATFDGKGCCKETGLAGTDRTNEVRDEVTNFFSKEDGRRTRNSDNDRYNVTGWK